MTDRHPTTSARRLAAPLGRGLDSRTGRAGPGGPAPPGSADAGPPLRPRRSAALAAGRRRPAPAARTDRPGRHDRRAAVPGATPPRSARRTGGATGGAPGSSGRGGCRSSDPGGGSPRPPGRRPPASPARPRRQHRSTSSAYMKYDSSNPPTASKAARRTRKQAPDTQSTVIGPRCGHVELGALVAAGEPVVRGEDPEQRVPGGVDHARGTAGPTGSGRRPGCG